MCLATTAKVYALLRIRITIFSNGSIIPPDFKFTELHALTLAARSYVLLIIINAHQHSIWLMMCVIW